MISLSAEDTLKTLFFLFFQFLTEVFWRSMSAAFQILPTYSADLERSWHATTTTYDRRLLHLPSAQPGKPVLVALREDEIDE